MRVVERVSGYLVFSLLGFTGFTRVLVAVVALRCLGEYVGERCLG
jgi:hypothetical protein